MADETHHRDVNHTFADMQSDDPNPYVTMHKENAAHAWRLELEGETSSVGKKVNIPSIFDTSLNVKSPDPKGH